MQYLAKLLVALEELQVKNLTTQSIIAEVLAWYTIANTNTNPGLQHGWSSVSFALNYGIPPSYKIIIRNTLAYRLIDDPRA